MKNNRKQNRELVINTIICFTLIITAVVYTGDQVIKLIEKKSAKKALTVELHEEKENGAILADESEKLKNNPEYAARYFRISNHYSKPGEKIFIFD